MKSLIVFIIVISVFIGGCASLKDLTARDIRTDKYFYKSYSINKTIEKIKASLYQYKTNCSDISMLEKNPSDNNSGTTIMTVPGLTQASTIVVIDYNQRGNGTTLAKSYSYYSAWEREIDKTIKIINDPHTCL